MPDGAESRTSRATPSEPVKLRAACNHCHASKVRCSGERRGCNRCLSLGHMCVYAESRVGKVPGIRGKKRNAQNPPSKGEVKSPAENSSNVNNNTHGGGSNNMNQSPAPIEPLQDPTSDFSLDDAFMDWTNTSEDYDFDDAVLSDSRFFQATQEMSDAMMQAGKETPFAIGTPTSSEFHPQLLNIDPNLEKFSTPPTSSDGSIPVIPTYGERVLPQFQPPQHPARSASVSMLDYRLNSSRRPHSQQRHRELSRWMNACTRIVEYLEYRTTTGPPPLDEAMGINKISIARILNLANFKDFEPKGSLPGLLCIALDHVVTLFEVACADFPPKETSQDSLSKPESWDFRLPRLQFGGFQIDPEEQLSIHVQIVVKELQRCLQALDEVGNRLSILPRDDNADPTPFTIWFSELEARLKALVSLVGST